MASHLKKPIPIHQRPQMLKDFLREDHTDSCSSSGFKSFPRTPYHSAIDHRNLRRSRSKAAEATISALQKFLNAVKSSFQSSSSSSSPLSLTRNLSRRLSRRRRFLPAQKNLTASDSENAKVKVKDILRWRSFRDDVKESYPPLDSPTPLCADSEQEAQGGRYHGVGPEEKLASEDKEQYSPVSVLDSPFREDGEFSPSFYRSLANVERTKSRLLESIQWFERLAGVEPGDLDEKFSLEEETKEEGNGAEGRARELMQHIGADDATYWGFTALECEVGDMKEREACFKGMEREVRWSEFKEEREGLALSIEITMLNVLLDDVLFDLMDSHY